MSRVAYDNTARIKSGPLAIPANTHLFDAACHLVPNRHYGAMSFIVSNFTHYVNWTGPPTSAGTTTSVKGTISYNPGTADIWEIPIGSGQFYRVLWSWVVRPGDATEPAYNRANLLRL